jgi:O-antigen ligase
MPLLIASLFVILPAVLWFGATLVTPLLGLIALSSGYVAWRQGYPNKAGWRRVLPMLLLLTLWPVLSSLWANSSEAFGKAAGHAAIVILGSLVLLPQVTAWPLRYWRVMAVSLTLCALIVASEMLPSVALLSHLSDMFGGDAHRFMVKTLNRALCAFAVLLFPILVVLWQQGSRGWTAALIISFTAALTAAASISAWLGWIAGWFTLGGLLLLPRIGWRVLMAVMIGAMLIAVPLTSWFVLSPERLVWLYTQSPALHVRAVIWHDLLQFGAGHPWLGWGFRGSAQLVWPPHALAALGFTTPPTHPHHSLLQIWLDLGVVGVLLVTCAVGWLLRVIYHALTQLPLVRAAALATFVAYIAAGASSFSVWQSWWVAVPWLAVFLWRRAVAR